MRERVAQGSEKATPDEMVPPPTNATETLHLGHVLTVATEDAMMRWQRMSAYDAQFVAGVDHAGVTAQGHTICNSPGNSVDPLNVVNAMSIEDVLKCLKEGNLGPDDLGIAREGKMADYPDGTAECGIDVLRFSLISSKTQADKINLDIKSVAGYRQWCSNLCNAIRFARGKFGDHYTPSTIIVCSMPPICKWILSSLNKTVGNTVMLFEAFELSAAASAIHSWWQNNLCDVFIEAIKPYFLNDSQEFESIRATSRDVLWVCLDAGLRLLHPFMPYVTEELWQRLPPHSSSNDSIMMSEYPSVVKDWTDGKLVKEIGIVLATVNALRSMRLPSDKNERRPAFALCRGQEIADTVQYHESLIVSLSSISSLKIMTESDGTVQGCETAQVNKDIFVYIQRQGVQNAEAEHEKIRKKSFCEGQKSGRRKEKRFPLHCNLHKATHQENDCYFHLETPADMGIRYNREVCYDLTLRNEDEKHCLRLMKELSHINVLEARMLQEGEDASVIEALVEPVTGFLSNLLNDEKNFFGSNAGILKDLLSQIVDGIEYLRVSGYYHGNLSMDTILYQKTKSRLLIKLSYFERKGSMPKEKCQMDDWTAFGELCGKISELIKNKGSTQLDCCLLDDLANKLKNFSFSSLNKVKKEVMQHPIFWDFRRKREFFICEIPLALRNDGCFKQRIKEFPVVCPWVSDDYSGCLAAMNKYRLKKGFEKYNGDSRVQFVEFVSGLYVHEKELEGYKKGFIDNMIQQKHPRICLDLLAAMQTDSDSDSS